MNDFLQNLRNGQAEKQRTAKTRKNYDNSYHYNTPRYQSYVGYQSQQRPQQSTKRPPAGQPGTSQPYPAEETTMDILAEAIENLGLHVETLAKNQEFLINAQDRTADILERQAVAIEEIVRCLHSFKDTPFSSSTPIKESIGQLTPERSTPVRRTPERRTPERTTPERLASESIEPENKIVEDENDAAMQATETDRPASFTKEEKSTRILRKSKKGGVTRKIAVPPAPKKARNLPEQDTSRKGSAKLLGRDTVMGIINSMREEGATFDQIAKHLIDLGQPTFSGRGEWHAQTIHRLCSKKK